MTTRDEPLTDEPTQPEIEEISDDLILEPGETLPGAVHAPGTEPSEVFPTGPEVAIPAKAAPAKPIARPAEVPAPAPRAEERLDEASTRVVIVPRESAPRSRFPLLVALVFLFCGFGAGFFAGQLWERQGRAAAPLPGAPATSAAAAGAPAPAEGSRPPAAPPKRAAKPAKPARAPRASSASSADRAKLDVTAPAGAEVYLDGKRIGRGPTHTTVAPGRHRIEVRVGKNRVAESFDAEPGGTWTYDVSPTK